jgi:hypothetical protein
MFILAPATRWGYFAYPLGLLGWLALTGPVQAAPDVPVRAGSAAAVPAPAAAGLASGVNGFRASPQPQENGHRDPAPGTIDTTAADQRCGRLSNRR